MGPKFNIYFITFRKNTLLRAQLLSIKKNSQNKINLKPYFIYFFKAI